MYQRHLNSQSRLRKVDVEQGLGHKYFWSREQLLADWRMFEAQAVDITRADLDPWRTHSEPRWWAELPRAELPPVRPSESGKGDLSKRHSAGLRALFLRFLGRREHG